MDRQIGRVNQWGRKVLDDDDGGHHAWKERQEMTSLWYATMLHPG